MSFKNKKRCSPSLSELILVQGGQVNHRFLMLIFFTDFHATR